jgi:hypothetical protein
LGTFAFWYAHSSGSSNSLSVFGWATPDFVVGQVTMNSNSGSGIWSFFRWFLGKTYFLHGNAATSPTAN